MDDDGVAQPPQPIVIQTGTPPEPTPRLDANTSIPATSMKLPGNLSPQTVEAYQSIMPRKPNNLELTLLAVSFPLMGWFIGIMSLELRSYDAAAFCGISLLLGIGVSLSVWVRGGLWNNASKEAGQRVLKEAGVPDTPPKAWPGTIAALCFLLFIIVGVEAYVVVTVVLGSYHGWRQSLYRKELNRKVRHLLNVNNSASQE